MSASLPPHLQLIEAIRAEDLDRARQFIEGGADCEEIGRVFGYVTDEERLCIIESEAAAVHHAAELSDNSLLRLMGERGVNLHLLDLKGKTPLHWAADGGSLANCQYLLAQGADVTHRDFYGDTALHLATDSSEVVRLLLSYHAEVDAIGYHSRTPLASAASDDNIDSVNLLLAAGADPKSGRLFGEPMLNYVLTTSGALETVEAVLKAGSDVNQSDSCGDMPLHIAAGKGEAEKLKLLVEYGADVMAPDIYGCTALQRACVGRKHVNAVDILIDAGADVSHTDDHWETALHEAAASCNYTVCDRLIKAGADRGVLSTKGYTPLDLAMRSNTSLTRSRFASLLSLLRPDEGPKMSESGEFLDKSPYLHPDIVKTLAEDRVLSVDLSTQGNKECCWGSVSTDGNRVWAGSWEDVVSYEYVGQFESGIDLLVLRSFGWTSLLLVRHSNQRLEKQCLVDLGYGRQEAFEAVGSRLVVRSPEGDERVCEVEL